ncbi:hypothetical protein AGMMS50293_00820 [Spirochaetia bacterium]|nr:hypothetical protein AGMMS50293_00820 [Spirochaetia bacterium]
MNYVKIAVVLLSLALVCYKIELPKKNGDITGNTWALVEVRTQETIITLERLLLERAGMGDAFTLRFEGYNCVLGTAAATHYNASCEWGDNSTIGIGPVSTIQTAVARELPFREKDYFEYLERVGRWTVSEEGQMVLYSMGYASKNWIYLTFGKYF